ncbi:hypothetical protein E2562_014295 [Oryza meyeriana var. granulata]|uniref:Uncharacterized protein n=1 Tax=Oryza meyeriana var. granulata TaxID=110450 RepID=A0A6G1C678_9ORYZ|nr:hypothetical protein E2562_014295 [Oryza meyeriana var. granulata]
MAARIPTISLPPDLGGSLIVIDIGGLACLDPLHIQFFAPAVLIRCSLIEFASMAEAHLSAARRDVLSGGGQWVISRCIATKAPAL